MELKHIDIAHLSVSPANMRAKGKAPDLANILPSVRARGVLVPLIVRQNGSPDSYEIVAGKRRYHSALTAMILKRRSGAGSRVGKMRCWRSRAGLACMSNWKGPMPFHLQRDHHRARLSSQACTSASGNRGVAAVFVAPGAQFIFSGEISWAARAQAIDLAA